jgi:hypothetical protein
VSAGPGSLPVTTVYGLSTEGYNLASSIALKGAKVSVVDDSAGMAISVKPDVARTYPNVNALIEDGPLLAVEPIDLAINNAAYVFFAPRIRKIGPDVKIDLTSKFQDAIRHIKKNSSIIYAVPTGFGANMENIALIEHITGLKIGKDVSYYYFPLSAHTTTNEAVYVGTYRSKQDMQLSKLLTTADTRKKINFIDISSLEIMHSIQTLRQYSVMSSILEICRYARDVETTAELQTRSFNEIYLDDIANGLYDLRAISSSIGGTSPLTYIVNGTVKSIEGYAKHLIDETRMMLKKRDLKASRTKVTIAWTVDQNEMRGDKLELLSSIVNRLKDYIGEVETQRGSFDLYPTEKTMIVIACSKGDLNNIISKSFNSEIIVIKAIPILQTIE